MWVKQLNDHELRTTGLIRKAALEIYDIYKIISN